MIHGLTGNLLQLSGTLFTTNKSSRVTNSSSTRRNIDKHKRPRSDLGTITNLDIAEQDSASADEHAIANLGVTIANNRASATKSNIVENGNIATDGSSLTDNQACCVIEQDSGADTSSRVDVHMENFRDSALHEKGE